MPDDGLFVSIGLARLDVCAAKLSEVIQNKINGDIEVAARGGLT